MQVIDLPLSQLMEAPWNPNRMDEAMLQRLRKSLSRYGLVENLVVRALTGEIYEVLSGNRRLQVIKELGYVSAPCVVVTLSDAHARLLSQALNRIQGEDDLGLRAEILQKVLKTLPEEAVLALLPETTASLKALSSLGQETMAQYLQTWQQAQGARLKHLTFQLSQDQWEVVEEAMAHLLPLARDRREDSPNTRGTALYLLCLGYLERERRPA